jgi:hypothetical protein
MLFHGFNKNIMEDRASGLIFFSNRCQLKGPGFDFDETGFPELISLFRSSWACAMFFKGI